MIGFLRVVVVAVPLTLWWASFILWSALRRSPRLRCRCESVARRWARGILRAAGTRVTLEGESVIDPDRPQVLVSNHVSWFDVLVLAGYLPGPFRFVAKKELANIPFFGPAWRACGHISIDRQDRSKAIASLAVARQKLEEDRPTVILFPEGTRSPTGELRSFKKGAFVLAIQTGVEVVPAAILGTREIMPKGSWRIRTGRPVTVRFGAPLAVDGLTEGDRDELTRMGHAAVGVLLASGVDRSQPTLNESK